MSRTITPQPPMWPYLFWLLFWLLFLHCSCTPLRRLENLEKKHPYLFNRSIDTIKYRDTFTVIVPGVKTDTFFHQQKLKDTVFIENKQLRVKLWQKSDTVYVNASCDTVYQEVIREIAIPYTKYNAYRRARDRLRWELILAVIVIVGGWITNYYIKIRHEQKTRR